MKKEKYMEDGKITNFPLAFADIIFKCIEYNTKATHFQNEIFRVDETNELPSEEATTADLADFVTLTINLITRLMVVASYVKDDNECLVEATTTISSLTANSVLAIRSACLPKHYRYNEIRDASEALAKVENWKKDILLEIGHKMDEIKEEYDLLASRIHAAADQFGYDLFKKKGGIDFIIYMLSSKNNNFEDLKKITEDEFNILAIFTDAVVFKRSNDPDEMRTNVIEAMEKLRNANSFIAVTTRVDIDSEYSGFIVPSGNEIIEMAKKLGVADYKNSLLKAMKNLGKEILTKEQNDAIDKLIENGKEALNENEVKNDIMDAFYEVVKQHATLEDIISDLQAGETLETNKGELAFTSMIHAPIKGICVSENEDDDKNTKINLDEAEKPLYSESKEDVYNKIAKIIFDEIEGPLVFEALYRVAMDHYKTIGTLSEKNDGTIIFTKEKNSYEDNEGED